ncbi:MAG TPA: MMPL family transporter [Acidimicrobiia bacterium]|jgi:RND superfamily putative drug exporter|nr:MMPL family transporter [Acidimicrobiia bacterium]
MAAFLDRLGRAAARHRWWVIGAWVVLVVVVGGVAKAADGKTEDTFRIPGAQSQQAADLLAQRFPSQAGDVAFVVFDARHGTVHDAAAAAGIAQTQRQLASLPHVTGQVLGPATPEVGNAFVSADGTIAYARVQYDQKAGSLPADTFTRLQAAAHPAGAAGLTVAYGGAVTDFFNQPPPGSADAIGLLVAVIILLLAFGSVIAMSLPIGTALFGLAVGLSLISIVSAITPIGTVAPTLATMIGLGVGIDYSLFILTRHRQNLVAGMPVLESIGLANGTAGQAVLFAGTTVVIAICGLALAGIPYVTWLGFTSAMVVLVMMAAAVTLIPALLAVAGEHINKVHAPRFHRHHRGADHPSLTGGRSHGWTRWAEFMSRHRWAAVLGSLVVLLVLASPLLSMRLGQVDDSSAPHDSTQRIAYDLISRGFGPGFNGPLVLAVALPHPGDTAPAAAVAAVVSTVPGVKVGPPELSPTHTAAVVVAVPASSPQSAATETLVNHLRDDVLPPAVRGTGAQVYVGGVTAAFIDLGQKIQARLPLFIGAVILLSFVLLMMVFRSVLVPLKAAIMNLLSIGAAFGVIVAVFQWGWGASALGVAETTPIVAYVPMMMFAILFGLSMDYEVFLLSRIREDYFETHDNLASVINGLGVTARVITSAALIMISVFLGFLANPEPTIKMFGLGLAVAVFVDATIVRLVLVPATMELLGDANWWLPRWLDRVLPSIRIEEGPTNAPGPVDERVPVTTGA